MTKTWNIGDVAIYHANAETSAIVRAVDGQRVKVTDTYLYHTHEQHYEVEPLDTKINYDGLNCFRGVKASDLTEIHA